jgi:hypothetical protein
MLLSKLKVAFLGLIAVSLITTGAGVVAQDRPSDNDRLKNLERKVDRLLEALGAQHRRAPADLPNLDAKPQPNPTPRPPTLLPATPGSPAPANAVPPLPAQPPAAPGAHAHTPFENAPPAAVPPPPAAAGPLAPPTPMAPTGHAGHPGSQAGRLDSLERRLASLERRFAEFERRLSRLSSGDSPFQGSRNLPVAHPAPRAEQPANVPPLPSPSSIQRPFGVAVSAPEAPAPPPAAPAPPDEPTPSGAPAPAAEPRAASELPTPENTEPPALPTEPIPSSSPR